MAQPYSHVLMVTGSRSWDDEASMKASFNDAWLAWGPSSVVRPVLLSGHCPKGADAMAERLWRAVGFEVLEFPADWDAEPRTAGLTRNQQMIDVLADMRDAGTPVKVSAFLDLCRRCDQSSGGQQLMPSTPGHFSHGTVHARSRALAAGVDVDDVVHPSLPPF